MLMNQNFTRVLGLFTLLLAINISAQAQMRERGFKASRMWQTKTAPQKGAVKIPKTNISLSRHEKKPLYASASGTVIYGDVVYSSAWTDGSAYGVYSFPAQANTTLTELATDNYLLNASGGAIYQNGVYHVLTAIRSGQDITGINYYALETDSWSEINESELSADFTSADMAVDPLSRKIYGSFANDKGGSCLATVDFDSFRKNVIGDFATHIAAIAINGEETIYGIGADNNLYTINSTTAELTLVGSTGITNDGYTQSATIDLKDGKMYWATTVNDEGHLYEVNLQTGEASLISKFPNDEQIVGLYTLSKLSEDNAPNIPTNLSTTFEGASTKGSVSFTLPSTTNIGEDIDGELSYTVIINGKEAYTGKAAAGSAQKIDVNGTEGDNTIVVRADNLVGKGTPATAHIWLGYDIPMAATEAKATYADGKATITWTAPTEGTHGGYFDANALTYNIVRQPDNITVAQNISATKYEDQFKPSQLGAYYYEVTATANGKAAKAAKTNPISAGDAIEPTYTESFDNATTQTLLTVIDGDGDGEGFSFITNKGYATISGSPDGKCDDWIVTPPLKLSSERLYKASFNTLSEWAGNYNYTASAYYGSAPSEESLTNNIIPEKHISDNIKFSHSNYFSVKADGTYHVGFNITGYALYDVRIDSIAVEAGPYFTAPDSVTNLKITAAQSSKDEVTVAFRTPTKTINGNALTALSKIEILRNKSVIKTFDNVKPDTDISFTDDAADDAAENLYSVVAYNESGAGIAAEDSVYAGLDTPTAPLNVELKAEGSKGTLSWNAPDKGIHNGYISRANMQYAIADQNQQLVAKTIGIDRSIDVEIPQDGEQAFQYYYVFALNRVGNSQPAMSNPLISGADYQLPFSEDFANGERHHFIGMTTYPESGHGAWGMGDDYHGNQFFQFNNGMPGNGSKLFTGKISLAGSNNPVLEYKYVYRDEANEAGIFDGSFKTYIVKDDKDTTLVSELTPTSYSKAKDFELVRVPLAQFKGSDHIQVLFDATTGSEQLTLAMVDDINVREFYDDDLTGNASAPKKAKSGETINITSRVKNIGKNTVGNYSVDLYENGRLIASQPGKSIATDDVADYAFSVKVGSVRDILKYNIVVNDAADLYMANNVSDTIVMAVEQPLLPTPKNLTAEADGSKASLSWNAPEYEQFALPITEDFESYEPFATDILGTWSIADADKETTINSVQIEWYDYALPTNGKPMAWTAFNSARAGFPLTGWDESPTGWQSVSGNQFAASFTSATESGANDDWMISPELTGDAQTISFYQHGYYGMERYEVLYSTTGSDTKSFQSLGTFYSSADWTKVSYELPAGAKYFAIRNLGAQYSKYLFVDDINYAPAINRGKLRLQGYNIYRDEKLIATVAADAASYTDDKLPGGKHTYDVTAVYNDGESASALATVSTSTGINSATVSADAKELHRYTIDGRQTGKNSRGINIIRYSDGTARKVLAK